MKSTAVDPWQKALQVAQTEFIERHKVCGQEMKRLARCMPGGDTRSTTWFPPHPIVVESASGCQMQDVCGHVLYDFLGNYTSLVHGHQPSFVTAAIESQLRHGFVFGAPMKEHGHLAQEIVDRISGADLVRFTNSGTEATMLAARLAQAHTARQRLAVAFGSYHGSFPSLRWQDSTLTGTVVYPSEDSAETLRVLGEAGPLAAVFIEPVLASGGVITPKTEFLRFLREYCDSTGTVLVFDEVQTFRLGYGGRQGVIAVAPDLTALGKIIGGGLPIGAVAGIEPIMRLTNPSMPHPVAHGGTFNGHGLAMVGGYAALKHLDAETIERLNHLGDRLAEGIREACAVSPVPVSVTSCGSIVNVHAGRDVQTAEQAKAAAETSLAQYVHLGLINQGVYIASRGEMCVSTPMTETTIDFAVQAMTAVLKGAERFV